MDDFLEALKKYAQFTGRSDRKEFWYFVLLNLGLQIVASILDGIAFGGATGAGGMPLSPISSLVGLALFIPGLAVTFRRLHDINKTAWWILLGLIPLVGWVILIIWYAKKGDPAENQYGPAPDGSAA